MLLFFTLNYFSLNDKIKSLENKKKEYVPFLQKNMLHKQVQKLILIQVAMECFR